MESDLKGSFTEIVTLQGQWGLLQIPSALTSISSRRRCDNCSMWNLPRHNHLFGRAGKSLNLWYGVRVARIAFPGEQDTSYICHYIWHKLIRMILHGQWLVVVMRNLNIARRGWLLTTRWPDGHHATLWMDTKPHCGWTLSIGQWTPRAAHCGGGTTLSAHFTDHTCTFVTFLLNMYDPLFSTNLIRKTYWQYGIASWHPSIVTHTSHELFKWVAVIEVMAPKWTHFVLSLMKLNMIAIWWHCHVIKYDCYMMAQKRRNCVLCDT